MRKGFAWKAVVPAFLLGMGFLPSAGAQQPDTAALRALVPPPQRTLLHALTLTVGLSFGTPHGYAFVWEGRKFPAETPIPASARSTPRSWQAWVQEGQRQMAAAQVMTTANRSAPGEQPSVAGTGKPSAVQAVWNEAQHDFDTAVKLAPGLPQPYERRAVFRGIRAFAENPSMLSSMAGRQDFERAVALRPQEPYALAWLAWNEYSDYGKHYFPNQSYDNFAVWKVLPPSNRRRVLSLRHRVERLSASRSPQLRAQAYTALAWLEYEFHDVPASQAQAHLRQALQVVPDFPEAEELLMHTFAIEEQWEALAQFAGEQGRRHPGVRYDLIAAYACFKAKQPARTEAQTRAAVQRKPNDPAANLFLAYLYLRSDDPEKREKAGPCLDAAEAGLATADRPQDALQEAKAECAVLRAFSLALLGKQEEARQQFTHILEAGEPPH